ncbi:MAG: hypothetical protein KJ804_10625 [Proteobacteria bacterium]|nr:hypothetical protein [Pseudomonadota bacterium]MBU1058757.1 hypothetical protein [Pseudomonadota bacterium]
MLATKKLQHMLCKKTPLLLAILHFHLLCSVASAEPIPLFNADEIQKLNYSQDEWVIELNRHQSNLSSLRDTQAYSGDLDFSNNRELSSTDGASRTDREAHPGPIVSIVDPESEDDIYKSSLPLRLLIYLKSRLAPINIETLTVKGKRGIFTLNITNRIKSFMRQPQGDENADYVIDANIGELSAGRYLITLSLADIDGNQEEQKAFLEVR